MIQITLFKDYDLKDYTLIEAFPGIGLVASMTGSYIIEKLEMEYIGYIDSDLFPPIAAIHNDTPMFPSRIYKNDKFKLLVVVSEFTIPQEAIYQLSNELLAFLRKNRITRLISISGIPSQKPSDSLYILSLDAQTLKKADSAGIKHIKEGVVAGVSAVLLNYAPQYKITSLNLLVEVDPTIVDQKYAEIAIEGLNKLLDIKIDLTELKKEAEVVEAKLRELLKKTKDSHEHYNKATEAQGPSMYA